MTAISEQAWRAGLSETMLLSCIVEQRHHDRSDIGRKFRLFPARFLNAEKTRWQ